MEFLVRKENQRIFINNKELVGVQSVDVDSTSSSSENPLIGSNVNVIYPDAERFVNVTVNYNLISVDPFIQYTGTSGFNLYIVSRDNPFENFCGQSGFLNSYSLRAGVGEVPNVSVNATFYNDFISRLPENDNYLNDIFNNNITTYQVLVPSQGTIKLSGINNDFSKINGFNLDINCNRTQEYILGQSTFKEIRLIEPIQARVGINLNLKGFSPKSEKLYSRFAHNDTISLYINDESNTTTLVGAYFDDMELLSQKFSSNLGIPTANLEFGKRLYSKPDIVTDGLLWYFSASHIKSYPDSGFFWYDLSFNKHSGEFYNTQWPKLTGHMYLSGKNPTTAKISYFGITGFANSNEWTVCFWAKSNQITGTYFSFRGPSHNGPHLKAYNNAFYWKDGNNVTDTEVGLLTDTSLLGVFTSITGRWNHIGLTTKSDLNAMFYLNGNTTVVGTGIYSFITTSVVPMLTFGNPTGIGALFPYTGYLDEILVYNRILNKNEIRTNMEATRIS